MEITEVRIKLVDGAAERLLAFCSITIDGAFVIRDLKLIGGPSGPFVAMPSRKLCSHCRGCGYKNPLRACFCNQCGTRLGDAGQPRDDEGRMRLYADIAHPINAACREMLESRIVSEYEAELVRARLPGYVSSYEGLGDEEPRLGRDERTERDLRGDA
jgi:stage V sporulation protein G